MVEETAKTSGANPDFLASAVQFLCLPERLRPSMPNLSQCFAQRPTCFMKLWLRSFPSGWKPLSPFLHFLTHSSLNCGEYFIKNTPPPVVQDLGYSSDSGHASSLPLFASVLTSLYSPLSSCRLVVYTFCLLYVKQPKSDCHGCRQYDPDNQYPVQF